MVALALELQRRGHTPVIATSESYREKIAATGVAFHASRPNITPDDKDLLRAAMDEHGGPEYVIRRLMVPAVRGMYADLMEAAQGADLLVSAELVFAADSVAAKARRRAARDVLVRGRRAAAGLASQYAPHRLRLLRSS